ncbi:MAG TPA: hypothetical protein VFW62_05585, partial [bacterium]|nr:hypothetical protein [bacterium]
TDKEAQKAFENYEKKKFGQLKNLSPTEMAKIDREIKLNLIQINIAGVNALYSDDLGPYFKKIYKDAPTLRGMSEKERRAVEKAVGSAKEGDDQKESAALPTEGWVVEIRGYAYHKAGEVFVMHTILENLKNPTPEMKNTPAFKEIKSRIEDRVSFLFMYLNKKIADPKPGEFELIKKSFLKTLIKGETEKGGKGAVDGAGAPPKSGSGGGQDNMQVAGQGADAKPKRDNWKPIGEVASSIYGDVSGGGGMFGQPNFEGMRPGKGGSNIFNPPGGAGPVGPDPKLPKGAAQAPVERTEFVVLFIWREPLAGAVAEAKKE